MNIEAGKIALNTSNCDVQVEMTAAADGMKLHLIQGSDMVILSVAEWNDVRRAADMAINFAGEVAAR